MLITESEEELKSLLMKMKEESEKVGLKLNIQRTKIMASGPITSWEIDGGTVETVADYFGGGGSKITADGDCNHKVQRRLLLGRNVMTNLGSILKSRDITLSTNFCLVKAMVFPVVLYGCESWIIKKAEHQRIDAFELWCWRRLLRVPWTSRRSNQSILKDREAWCAEVYGVAKSWTWLSDWTELNHLVGAVPLPLCVGYLFLVRSNILLSMVVQQQVAILEFSQEKISAILSTPLSCLLFIRNSHYLL